MALIAAGTFNTAAAFVDTVRGQTYAAEASVTAGGTQTDDGTSLDGGGGASRNTAETHKAAAAGNRIPIGTLAHDTSFTVAVRFIARNGIDNDGDYMSLISKGGVFENDTQYALGFRDATSGNRAWFGYARNAGTLIGSEAGAATPSIDAGSIYTALLRWQNGTQQVYVWDGTTATLRVTDTDNGSTDGSQVTHIGGPNTFTSTDTNINAGFLGVLIYDEYVNDATRDAIFADFYSQIPAAGGGGGEADTWASNIRVRPV